MSAATASPRASPAAVAIAAPTIAAAVSSAFTAPAIATLALAAETVATLALAAATVAATVSSAFAATGAPSATGIALELHQRVCWLDVPGRKYVPELWRVSSAWMRLYWLLP